MKKAYNRDLSYWKAHLKMVKRLYKPGTSEYLNSLVGGIDNITALEQSGLTMNEFRVLVLIEYELRKNNKSYFCYQRLKDYLEKHGFILKEDGIGWIAFCIDLIGDKI